MMILIDNLCDRKFSVEIVEDVLQLSINYETDISRDGGYSFERETATFDLTEERARALRDVLDGFVLGAEFCAKKGSEQ